ncbi:LysM peptidoglycan-binding domain-containing protein [Bacillus suaedae]|uniref:LysM peptidoglycan-binding domain-containing protein n=1 Tax=Halalkalibacter suaedae TaxID=2822140 RepID=A0A940WY53_9BACI|nr:LysM peptidoglycan-binding domain-containing protein [Bacillus suaedae]MBP3950109.1 LysM peptidoglycan-binding domain-containing protein [Bacillus suaedae]
MKKSTKILAPTLAMGMVLGTTSFSASAATTVESGDTLWGIAQEHDVTVEELMEMNGDLDPRAIPIGTEIQVNAEGNNNQSGDVVTHTVQPGNTLSGIASVYDGVTLNDLYEMNPGIDPYNLMIGSEVAVADHSNDNSSTDVVYHTIQPGNTYFEIANAYDGVTVEDLIEANPNVDHRSLTVGSQIAVPVW